MRLLQVCHQDAIAGNIAIESDFEGHGLVLKCRKLLFDRALCGDKQNHALKCDFVSP